MFIWLIVLRLLIVVVVAILPSRLLPMRRPSHLFEGVVVSGESGLEADADGRDAGRPLAVGQAPVDLLTVERVQRVAVLAVVPDDDERNRFVETTMIED